VRAYSRVAPTFWTGNTGRALRGFPDGQRIALYLATSPSAMMTGVYYLPLPTLCHEVGITPKRARAALEVLHAEGFAEYDYEASVVWVPEMARCQVGNDPKPDDKRIKGFLRELESVPHAVFVGKFVSKYRDAFHLDEESIRKVLPGGFGRGGPASKGPPDHLRRGSEGASKDHRSPAPAPAPAPEPAPTPAPDPEREAARAREDEAFRVWEENRGRLKGVTKRSDERRRKIAARLKEVPDLGRWRATIQRFARGWAGGQSWATLDFLIKSETNFLKVEEGTYDESTTRATPRPAAAAPGARSLLPQRSSRRGPEHWDDPDDALFDDTSSSPERKPQ
jgi:hypothetical protein